MPTEPLTDAERAALRRWERTQILFFGVFMGLLAAIGILDQLGALTASLRTGLAAGVVLLAIAGVRHRLGRRCPRCDYHLGRAVRFLLPARCPRCGVSYRDDERTG